MQYRSNIPEGVKAGQIVPVKVSGVIVSVRLPKGIKVHDTFVFEVSRETWEAARSNPPDNNSNITPLQAEVVRRRRSILSRVVNLCSCSYINCGSPLVSGCAFSIMLGMILYCSIAVGFVMGILSVTYATDGSVIINTQHTNQIVLDNGAMVNINPADGGTAKVTTINNPNGHTVVHIGRADPSSNTQQQQHQTAETVRTFQQLPPVRTSSGQQPQEQQK